MQDLSNYIFNVLELKYESWLIEYLTATIISITHMYDLDFVECVESAYNTIKDRKGKLVNGTYVKSEDLKNEITDIFFDSSTDVSH